ncbi:MAG: beta-N-acetylhexosaminidase [Treponema sp.]|jgi:hexosaminidase|nr:beta-N-acetylhexosaminidase [Treponema sp.]
MNKYAIIPEPVFIQNNDGNFQYSGLPLPVLSENNINIQNEIQIFNAQVINTFGKKYCAENSDKIKLEKSSGNANAVGAESYQLEILSDEIRISAPAGTGIFRGLQTLRQLFLSGYNEGVLSIPCGIIKDKPRFPWRGFMLDCSRYFYSIEFIKKILDALSLQHINIFHWHLSDDQGWRLPVRQYPLLTEIGSKRRDHRLHDKFTGGFYTEAEIRDIVDYAARRHIETVPEIDLPGHTSAILAAYPGLGCTGGPYRVEDRYSIFEDVLCAGNDDIFPLAEALFDTLAELFPSKYVHIGGDEVRFNRWAECPKCKNRLQELGLKKPAQLQSWITARLAAMLQQRGKTAIGWDEVLENTENFPLPDDFIVMSWRGQKGGVKAAARGHRVIMAPYSDGCYLDYKHINHPEEPGQLSVNTIAQCFKLNPVTPEMDEASASLVLGGQGNLWSEIIYAGKIAEYMIFPRICALAETFWSDGKDRRSMEDFSKRLEIHQRRLDKLNLLQYRGPLK